MRELRATLGSSCVARDRRRFLVWAPTVKRVEVVLVAGRRKVVAMRRRGDGYHQGVVEGVEPGARYVYRLDGLKEFPDPASRFQPDGVHGASAVVGPEFPWTDGGWLGMRLEDCVLYELHVGTFTPEGTFAGVIRRLRGLKELGVTAIELMPVAQFPGSRNWGYDGVYPYAVQNTYGGPAGLKRLVNAAHRAGLAVVLDVVYNHVGPEGNHLGEFGPYFRGADHTPWGRALNFDGPGSEGVRRFFIENALYWQREFHIDGLRLDAIHAIRDSSARPFVKELAEACRRQAKVLGRPFHLIGEGGLDIVRGLPASGRRRAGLDAEWREDFHHCLHVLLTGEQTGYYARFGGVAQFAGVWRAGKARRSFVVFSQNHDQVGNRPGGERLAALVPFEAQKLAAATVLLSPFVPLLFMGEEYGERAPFHYFVSHSESAVIRAVREARQAELAGCGWRCEPRDPQDGASFGDSKLNRGLAEQGGHRLLREFYRELMRLRRMLPLPTCADGGRMNVHAYRKERVLVAEYSNASRRSVLVFNYSGRMAAVVVALAAGRWRKRLDSASAGWDGPGGEVPDEVRSRGGVKLRLPARSVLVVESGALFRG